jgi:lysophospholipase L1-like esterase
MTGFVVVAVLFVLTELLVRASTLAFTSYDIEMARYTRELKIPAEPALGHVHRPGSRAHLMDVDVQINSDGLRDREYPVTRTTARRFLFLGDSLTFGWGVAADATFEAILEAELGRTRPTEVLNLGIGNYNTVQEVRLLEVKGLKYAPDDVVVFYFINDAEATPRSSAWGFLDRSYAVTFFWSKGKALRSRLQPQRSFRSYYAMLYEDDRPGWRAARDAFARLKSLCDPAGIRLRVVLLPELHQLDPYAFAPEHAKVASALDALGVLHLDVSPSFRGQDPRRLWVATDDAHPNAAAHRLIATATLPFLEDR